MRKVSLERHYFVSYNGHDGALTLKMPKMALNPFCDKTLNFSFLFHHSIYVMFNSKLHYNDSESDNNNKNDKILNTLWCYVQTLGCNFSTWGCGPLLTPNSVTFNTPVFYSVLFSIKRKCASAVTSSSHFIIVITREPDRLRYVRSSRGYTT